MTDRVRYQHGRRNADAKTPSPQLPDASSAERFVEGLPKLLRSLRDNPELNRALSDHLHKLNNPGKLET
jgi:hypothetical protein